MNRDCENYYDLIEDLAAGEELDEGSAAQAGSHLAVCAECRREYEFQRQEKEIFARYLFDFEPPHDSWAELEARLIAEETACANALIPARAARRKGSFFDFGFSPAFAALAGLLLFFAIGCVWLKNNAFEKNNFDVAETKPENSSAPLPEVKSTDQNPADLQKDTADTSGDAPQSNERRVKTAFDKNRNTALPGKKQFVSEALKIKPKAGYSGEREKFANANVRNGKRRAPILPGRSLESEIAEQVEKIELLLRSFRNVPLEENVAGFDVEYEKRQARKLLKTNGALQRNAEDYGISYAEEVLSRAEPFLLEIANLENNPAPDKILDIKQRVSSQNIIAGLQVYNSAAAAR